ncbi:RNA-binding Raly-like protein isoform X2 [Natator depressus]|uniref:RNA-binding Raly-like protein isoform X2 n=1 Tax=Natator depressus TaxID=27790 RepID=UPI003EB9F8E0
MTLFGSEDGCWRYLDMAREPKPSRARPGQKRQHGGTLYHSNCDLDYELYRDDFPYRVYEYQKIPPLINRIPVKTRRAHVGAGGKSSLIPHPGPRGSGNAALGRTKLRAEELHSIKGELSQIKAQVDSLLESLDRMDQRRERLPGERGRAESSQSPGAAEGLCCLGAALILQAPRRVRRRRRLKRAKSPRTQWGTRCGSHKGRRPQLLTRRAT